MNTWTKDALIIEGLLANLDLSAGRDVLVELRFRVPCEIEICSGASNAQSFFRCMQCSVMKKAVGAHRPIHPHKLAGG